MSMLEKDPRDRPKDALVVSRTLARIERRLMDQETKLSDDTTIVPSRGRLPRRVSSTPHTEGTTLAGLPESQAPKQVFISGGEEPRTVSSTFRPQWKEQQ